MLRPFRRSPLALCAALLLSTACLPERGKAPPGKPGVVTAAAAATKAKPAATPLPPVDPKDSCAAAALTMAPNLVVGKIGSVDVKASDLGDELASAEKQALRSYCNAIVEARRQSLDNFVHKTLLEEQAKAEGKSIQDYLKGRVDAEVQQPDDAAVQAFYDTNKQDQTPPLEMVRDQVIQAMTSEQTDAALARIIDEIETKNGVERRLPDISLPGADLSNQPHTPFLGPADAAVQVVEFSDFECPYCSRAAETMHKLKDKYANANVQFVYRHFPLPMHPNAQPAAEYAQCAQAQGKFWPMHDAIFAAQRELSNDKLKELAGQAGLDVAALEACLAAGDASKQVADDLNKGREVGVEGTPSFYINGKAFAGNPNLEGISKEIDAQLARKG